MPEHDVFAVKRPREYCPDCGAVLIWARISHGRRWLDAGTYRQFMVTLGPDGEMYRCLGCGLVGGFSPVYDAAG